MLTFFYTFRPFFSPGRSLACKQAILPLDFKATKRSEKVVKVRLIKSFLCSEQFKVDIYSISAFGFSREYERFDQVGQVLSLIPWRKLDGYQIF